MYQFVAVNTDYSDLWGEIKLVFILNHGQSFTEPGFSVNKLTSDVNMEEESLIAQRVIYNARQRLAYETKKGDKQKSEKEQKRKLNEEEVKEMKRQKFDLE